MPVADSRRTSAPPVRPVAAVTRIIVSRPRRAGASSTPCRPGPSARRSSRRR
jgi:hypothetical protein